MTARKARSVEHCEACDALFTAGRRGARFCSQHCRWAFWNRARQSVLYECPHCGKAVKALIRKMEAS